MQVRQALERLDQQLNQLPINEIQNQLRTIISLTYEPAQTDDQPTSSPDAQPATVATPCSPRRPPDRLLPALPLNAQAPQPAPHQPDHPEQQPEQSTQQPKQPAEQLQQLDRPPAELPPPPPSQVQQHAAQAGGTGVGTVSLSLSLALRACICL
jgi:hypothetical protein